VTGPVRLILDTSALLAYTVGSEHVGEPIREVTDEGAEFAVPQLCLVEAAQQADPNRVALLDVLVGHSHCIVVPVPADWRGLALAAGFYGSPAAASAAAAAADHQAYVLTAHPERYPGLPTIAI
jgi:hypothetical protein